jgi:hypothetical protein
MMCQYTIITCNKSTTLVGDVDNEGTASVGVGYIGNLCTFLLSVL